MQNAVLASFAIFTGKHVHWSLFFNKVVDTQPFTFIKQYINPRKTSIMCASNFFVLTKQKIDRKNSIG